MDKSFNSILDSFFGGTGPMINTIAGIIVLILGIILSRFAKKQSSKGKNTAAWICIGVACIALISGIFQLLVR